MGVEFRNNIGLADGFLDISKHPCFDREFVRYCQPDIVLTNAIRTGIPITEGQVLWSSRHAFWQGFIVVKLYEGSSAGAVEPSHLSLHSGFSADTGPDRRHHGTYGQEDGSYSGF